MSFIFISHVTQDDDLVKQLRIELEKLNLTVWVDSRHLRGDNPLHPEINQVIENAKYFMVILSPHAIGSPWVCQEIQRALEVEKQHQPDGYRVIPLLLPGVTPSALDSCFQEPPLVTPIQLKLDELSETLPNILNALGEKMPDDKQVQAFAENHNQKTVQTVLEDWSHTLFEIEQQNIEQLLNQNELQSARTAAQQLLQRCIKAGEKAYQGANYDIALASLVLGTVLKQNGAPEAALQPLHEAQQRFQNLVDADYDRVKSMVSVTMTEIGNCLTEIGQLEAAAITYQEAIQLAEKLNDVKSVAVRTGQIATIRMHQNRYEEALELYNNIREIFETLEELDNVAIIWQQIGMVYKEAQEFEKAEDAYQQALDISMQQDNQVGKASCLKQMGELYDIMGQLEDAIIFCQQAVDKYVELQNLKEEGKSRVILADTFMDLEEYDEARPQLQRAIECYKPYGYVAEPWTVWETLHDLEKIIHDPQATAYAHQQAIESFLAYRRDGGENHSKLGRLCSFTAHAIEEGKIDDVEEALAEGAKYQEWQPVISKLQAIVHGDKNPTLTDDPDLDYDDVVELKLLLERLQSSDFSGK